MVDYFLYMVMSVNKEKVILEKGALLISVSLAGRKTKIGAKNFCLFFKGRFCMVLEGNYRALTDR